MGVLNMPIKIANDTLVAARSISSFSLLENTSVLYPTGDAALAMITIFAILSKLINFVNNKPIIKPPHMRIVMAANEVLNDFKDGSKESPRAVIMRGIVVSPAILKNAVIGLGNIKLVFLTITAKVNAHKGGKSKVFFNILSLLKPS